MILSLLVSAFLVHAVDPSPCTEIASQSRLDPGDRVLWEQDINSDGNKDVYVQGRCDRGNCETGVYLSCGPGAYVSVLTKDFGKEGLRYTQDKSPYDPNWSVLRAEQPKKPDHKYGVGVVDEAHDSTDVYSKERRFNEEQFYRIYNDPEIEYGVPGNLAGEYVYYKGQYEQFYKDDELDYMWKLTLLGDYQAAHILFFKVYRDKRDFPRYKAWKEKLSQLENRRKLMAAGFSVNPQYIPAEWFEDPETTRHYLKVNLGNVTEDFFYQAVARDPKLLGEVVAYSADNIGMLPASMQRDENIVEQALAGNRSAIQFVHPKFFKDKTKMIAWCEAYKISVRRLHTSLKDDPEVADACMKARTINYQFFSEKIRGDYGRAEKVLARDGYMLAFAPNSVKSNLKIVKRAIANYPAGKKYLSPEVLKALGGTKKQNH